MILWPRTLLWRSVLLIALLLIAAHLAWLQIFRASEREPRALQVAQQIASVVNLTRAALITAQHDKRLELLQDLSQNEGIQVYLGEPGEKLPPLPDSTFLRIVGADLRQRLGPETRFAVYRNGVRGVWVSFTIDGDEYWVMQPRSRIERNDPLRWIGLGVLALLFALIGAYLIVARINRPLRALTRAAAEVGRGRMPPPVEESGPAEIQTLARAFNQMADDLKRLDDERALLLAGVSHDLRTPLSRIRLGLEMLDGRSDPELKAGMVQDIEDIDIAIGQFLDFARTADAEAVIADGDLNALIRSTGERYTRAGKPVRLDLTPLPPVPLRPVAMQRLVGNLIEHALRHGGADVEVASGHEQGIIFIEVRDRGPGIPPDQAERMLQPFTRLDTARGGPGTGLGLAIVDRIARLHRGMVKLLPREGGGLRVRAELQIDRTVKA
ncbi:MAG: HAMP domain-containing protein [Burkholderiales bacterium]|nr:HAMP domain-containing protein [Burkholderiales bacterium]